MKAEPATCSILVLSVAFACGTFSSPAAAAADDAPSRRPQPNVVLILADDQAWDDFGFMGNDAVQTPYLDQLAAVSARYPNGYVPMSVCRPSLATLLTGLYPHQHGIHFNHPPPGLRVMREMTAENYHAARATTDVLIETVPTLPRILAEQGYACLQTGKHWEGSWETAGFTHGMTLGRPADRLSPISGTREQTNGEWVAHGNGDAGLIIGRETMQPIENFLADVAGQQPFLIWYAPFLPHTPFDAPQRFRDVSAGRNVPPHRLPYYAEITRFDETVGVLMELLERHDAERNTLIVFLADNGFRPRTDGSGRQDDRSKLSGFDGGVRTPLLIHWPDRVVPGDHSSPVSSVDVVPTILHAVGLDDEVTDRMPGRNLMPSAFGESQLAPRPVFGAIYPNDAEVLGQPSRHVRGRWIRDGDYKLIVPGPKQPSLPHSLYNLAADPHESTNLIDDPAQTIRVAAMTRLLNAWWSAGDDAKVTQPQRP